jgi:hypothetical protein
MITFQSVDVAKGITIDQRSNLNDGLRNVSFDQ